MFPHHDSTYITNRGASGKLIKDKSLPNKCLLLLPHRFAIGCIDMGWIVRNDIIWAKRNGMPESVTDRFSKKHEYMFFMVKSEKYYFDLDAIRDKCLPLDRWGGNKLIAKGQSEWDKATGRQSYRTRDIQPNGGMSGKLIKDKSLPNKCLLMLPHRFAIGCIDTGSLS